MSKKLKNKFNDKDDFINENFPSIQFKRKKAKSNIKMFSKLLGLLVVAGVSGALFSSLVIENKYNNLVAEINEKLERDTVILEYSKLIENVKQSLVTISDSEANLSENKYFDGNTTGVIIESSGKVLTNYSKIKNSNDIYVKLPSIGSKPIKASLLVGNEDIDIAIIQINCDEDLIPIKFGSKSDIDEGQRVALISNSTSSDYIDNIIPGIVTATNRSLNIKNSNYKLLEINTPITTINTGGIISNINGELIGIASYKITNDMNQNGLYYAVDLSSLEEIISSTNEIRDKLGISEGGFINGDEWPNVGGFYIAEIRQEWSSYKSGLRPTDIIFEIDGQKMTNISQIYEILKIKTPGDILKCKVMRSGEVKELEIKIGKN